MRRSFGHAAASLLVTTSVAVADRCRYVHAIDGSSPWVPAPANGRLPTFPVPLWVYWRRQMDVPLQVTGFSNTEEAAVGKTEVVPFLLEDKLVEIGGEYSKAEEDWAEYAVADGTLVTGQNPSSSRAVAQLVLDMLA